MCVRPLGLFRLGINALQEAQFQLCRRRVLPFSHKQHLMQVLGYAGLACRHPAAVRALLPVMAVSLRENMDSHVAGGSGAGHAVVGIQPFRSAAEGVGSHIAALSCSSEDGCCATEQLKLQRLSLQGFKALKTLICSTLMVDLDKAGNNVYLDAINYPIGNR